MSTLSLRIGATITGRMFGGAPDVHAPGVS
jgi:hypothetical protein